ncbi:hypothetical protein DYB25_005960 [Aphanomyces astaci]|uniref:Uncharacterized protein n=1 Tax=Aphanomyces astaci TaxID=112090 RepID=A0A397B9J9_APHAT|nr:hypothetical protein AaE_016185 [Aphanomyces astaci]RHY14415.1 hypothetical protein DYB25_005960 [Aphanomyces astaci]RHY46483.1 hypothetical protein DYB34_010582 [Aphanomyces astaci]RHY62615.1 hypothetical protein DYB30_000109 [Aphanomyces astaci]RHY73593.1 hypothetical protein DYB38_013089 [Aphanomyces astaci]
MAPPSRVVQVFECPSVPFGRRESAPRTKKNQTEELTRNQKVDEQFKKAVDDVRSYNMKNATGKDKKKKELERVVRLGGKDAKQEKMPYNIMMAIKKKGAQRLESRVVEEKASGVVHGKKLRGKVSRRPKSDAGTQATKGRLKNGVLFVAKKDR